MKKLLSNPQYRQLQIIETLYDHSTLSLARLTKLIDSSEKTLRQDIQVLNDMIAPSEIEVSPVFGLKLKFDYKMSIESIYSLFLSHSAEFMLIEYVFFKKFHSLDSLAEELFISTSSLRRMITQINKKLKDVHFKIDSQTLDLVGTESQICNFMSHYLEEKYRNSFQIFPSLQLKVLDKFFLTAIKSPNYPDIEKLRIWTMVILTRIKNGHRLTYTEKQHDRLPKKIVNNLILKQLFKATFSIPLTLDVLFQLSGYLFNDKYCHTLEDLHHIEEKDLYVADFVQSLDLFLENISKKLNIQLKNKPELILNLYNLDALYYGNSYILYNKLQAFVESVTHDYSNFYQLIKKEINQNDFLKKKNWSQDAINGFFYMLITHWPDLTHSIEQSIPVFSAALFFNTDIEHIKMLQDRLSYTFDHRITFTIIDALTISDLQKQAVHYDLLVTNLFGINIKKTKLVVLPLAMKYFDLNKIEQIYLELLEEYKS